MLLTYLGLNTLLSFLSGSYSFIVIGLSYSLIAFTSLIFIDRKHRDNYLRVIWIFIVVYSLYLIISHYAMVKDPLTDYFIGIDEVEDYFFVALRLSDLSYSDIWNVSFTEGRFSNSPLYYALLGTFQKITELDFFYSYLALKMHAAFWASIIPGVVYLLCNRVVDKISSYKSAVIYGLFSFTFIYSASLLRDIYIAVIFCIALYLITSEKPDTKKYFILIILGLITYYLRLENGVFFLAFLGVWIYRSGSNNKFLLGTVALVSIAGIVLILGGIEGIYERIINIIIRYNERAYQIADQDSLGIQLRNLPIPLNYVALFGFGQISPFPFWAELRQGISWYKVLLYLPEMVAVLFWFSVWVRIIRNYKMAKSFLKKYKYLSVTVVLYILLISIAEPGTRRLMAVYPFIFMVYIHISKKVFTLKEVVYNSAIYAFLLVVYFILKTMI